MELKLELPPCKKMNSTIIVVIFLKGAPESDGCQWRVKEQGT